jgi:serralysin
MPAVSPDRDSIEYTVMTYRSYPGAPLTGYTVETWGYAQTPMMYDIAALQRLYGANFSFNNTDSVYTWSPSTGEMSINGAGQGAPGDGSGANSMNRILMTLWDGGGNDTYDLSAYGGGTTIDLRPGEWTTASQTQLSNLNGHGNTPHLARGNIANALLYNGDTHSLIENAIGGAGADTIIANQGANHLTGNGGADLFTWADTTSSGTGALADTIMDFVRGTDRIDLSRIDTNPATPADDPFAFLGTGAFTNHAGEVRYDVTGGAAHVFVDFDGNGVADLEIIVNSNTILASSDFVL